MPELTPMMQQYQKIKDEYMDTLLFYRLGDFYELFFEDAITASRELEITLTGRNCGKTERAPMCGVPHHSAQGYIDRLIKKGYKVAICEQTEDASAAAGIVRREVVRVITPGTVSDSHMLQENRNYYLASAVFQNERWGLSYTDLTTGELYCIRQQETQTIDTLIDELDRIQPSELLIDETAAASEPALQDWFTRTGAYRTDAAPYQTYDSGEIETILQRFTTRDAGQQMLVPDQETLHAFSVLYRYLEATQKRSLDHLNEIIYVTQKQTMSLDLHTRQNLELTESLRDKQRKGSLLWVLDKTKTAMGGRLLKRWIEEPLVERFPINQRLAGVTSFLDYPLIRGDIRKSLQGVYDLERLIGRIALQTATPRDLLALKQTLIRISEIRRTLNHVKDSQLVASHVNEMNPDEKLIMLLENAIDEDAPLNLKDGGVIRHGFDQEIDELKKAAREGKTWITDYEKQEREKTGIRNLKTGYNRVFGYYIEVTKSNVGSVPDYYQRKQTLVNCERYITDPLKDLEAKILGAEERSNLLEIRIFHEIREAILQHIPSLQQTAKAVAAVDVLSALAETAFQNRYQRPVITDDSHIKISNGRHAVVEKTLSASPFIPNDTTIHQDRGFIHLITGPNMAGKSTYMRQVALIILMAQMGSYVPADSAEIGIVDRLFTRIGASDDLSQGQSTFMMEMSEVSSILKAATSKSLIILDEVGRGTSTYDGMSIAWSVVEYIHKQIGAKTLFSTHYHELTVLDQILEGVVNYKAAVKENRNDIVFLRKMMEGTSDKSYGIQVAKLAGLPAEVLREAEEILMALEEHKHPDKEPIPLFEKRLQKRGQKQPQPAVSVTENPAFKHFAASVGDLNVMTMTPLEALNKLYELQKEAAGIIENQQENTSEPGEIRR